MRERIIVSRQEHKIYSNGPNKLQVSVRAILILLMAFASGAITALPLCSPVAPLVQAFLSGAMSTAGTLQLFDKITKPDK
jgi:hypothetical protein